MGDVSYMNDIYNYSKRIKEKIKNKIKGNWFSTLTIRANVTNSVEDTRKETLFVFSDH